MSTAIGGHEKPATDGGSSSKPAVVPSSAAPSGFSRPKY